MLMATKVPAVTTKLFAELADCPFTVTESGPVLAPEGTLTVSAELVAAVTVAVVPLNCTAFKEGVALNPWPWMETVWPIGPV